MGREVKRVPLDFDWPRKKVWAGYLRPDSLDESPCPTGCDTGHSPRGTELTDRWYGKVPFRPEETGSTPYTEQTPAIRAMAARHITDAAWFYGSGERAVRREARRLAALFNGSWSHHLAQEDVDALIAADQLRDFTHTVTDAGWQPKTPPYRPTAAEVNEWSITGMGHDSMNCWAVVRAACGREGVPYECQTCGGHATVEAYPGQRQDADCWEQQEPPTGDGFQLWETVSEGSPMSPVFATADDLAQWMSRNPCGAGRSTPSLEAARAMVTAGWAPSMIQRGDGAVLDGISAAGSDR